MRTFALTMILAAAILPAAFGQEPPANALPPGVTAEMEKDFLARYEAAIKTAKASKDPSGIAAYHALYAMDPSVPPDGKKAFEDFTVFAVAMDAMGGQPTYAFIPVPADLKASEDAPLTLAGKVYAGYLPPVIALKTTLAPPEHPDPSGMTPNGSTHPLCIQNGRLMLIGIKPVPGAVPPPMDKPADNFGLVPNRRKPAKDDDFNTEFSSLNEFLDCVKQPGLEVLASGQSDYAYYVVCRVKPDMLVVAEGGRRGKDDFDFTYQVTDSSQTVLSTGLKRITLVEDPPGEDGKAFPDVEGYVYKMPPGYTGPIQMVGKFGADFSKLKSEPALTVDWK